MTPFGAEGANTALRDAVVLSKAILDSVSNPIGKKLNPI